MFTLTISVLEHDPDILQHRGSVWVVIDQQQRPHLRVIEPTVWYPHVSKPTVGVPKHSLRLTTISHKH